MVNILDIYYKPLNSGLLAVNYKCQKQNVNLSLFDMNLIFFFYEILIY